MSVAKMDEFTTAAHQYAEAVTAGMINDISSLNLPSEFWPIFAAALRIAWMQGSIAARKERVAEIERDITNAR